MAAFTAAALIAPAGAWACDEPHGAPEAFEAGPGDKVGFVLPTTLEGAAYALSVEGRDEELARGEDDTEEPGVSDEFTVPDLGSEARRVAVVVHVTHEADGADWRWEMPLDYRGKEAAPPPPAAQPSATPAPTRTAPASSMRSAPVRGPDAAPSLVPYPGPSRGKGSVAVEDNPSPVQAGLGPVRPGLVKPSPQRRHAPAGKRRGTKRNARRRTNRFEAGRDPAPVKGRDVEPPRDTRTDLSDDRFAGFGYSIAWKLMAAVAIAGLIVPLLLGGLARRRRRRAAEIEAELQEIVSEERAKQATWS